MSEGEHDDDRLEPSHLDINPYASPKEAGEISSAAESAKAKAYAKVQVPGFLLLLFASISSLAFLAALIALCWTLVQFPQLHEVYIEAAVVALFIACHIFIAYSAWQMLRLRRYRLAWIACLISSIPYISPGLFFSVPFGVWGLLILRKRHVRESFES
jgi:hypothetical protein